MPWQSHFNSPRSLLCLVPSVITVLGSEEGGPRGSSYGVRLDIWEDQDSEACSHVYMLHILKIPRV